MRVSANHKQTSTHMPTLIKLIPKTEGDVCEMGAGMYSTPILHWLCQGRKLVTYENDPEYVHYAKKFQSYNHRVRNLNQVDFNRHWSVVFIDHTTRNRNGSRSRDRDRGDDVLKFTNADIFVLHDSESDEKYHYKQLWDKFKYRYDWKECLPHVSVISNKIDVCQLLS